MSTRAHVLVVVIAIATIVLMLQLVRRRHLRAKYSVLWVSIGGGLAVLAAWPALLEWLSNRFGIAYPPATLALIGGVFLLLLVLHFSWEISRLEERTRVLAEEHALLAEELRERRSGPGGPDSS